ncbi:cytidylate kinase [Alphaproteobacteria bacterium]|nr:cytidylate kinase [Alphaproteobacteria bacterium]
MKPIIIAIDGPVGAGKGTIAKFLAQQLSFPYIDSGLLYRYYAYRTEGNCGHGAASKEEGAAEKDFFEPLWHYFRTKEDLHQLIPLLKKETCGNAASKISRQLQVRVQVMAAIRRFAQKDSLVIDGRDTTTIIFPDASVKFFVTARPDVRAKRRLLELEGEQALNDEEKYRAYQTLIEERDARDSMRPIAPLLQAADAFVLDTSDVTIDQAQRAALSHVRTVEASL